MRSGAVLLMQEPGMVKVVIADDQLYADDVVADGRYIWVAGSYEWGLSVLDRDGPLYRVRIDEGGE